jgi:DNA-binding GntR family transcriptional regulator
MIPGFRPDLNDNSPLYMQVARKLIQDVRDGRYRVDQALPSERALSEQLDISRVTARKAIDQLVEQGLVVRRRGSGNYIAPRIEQPLSNLSSFSEQLQERGSAQLQVAAARSGDRRRRGTTVARPVAEYPCRAAGAAAPGRRRGDGV